MADYRGYTVVKCPTWTQGPALLQALRLLEGFDVAAMRHLSPDTVHLTTEALKLAFADRDTHYGDPAFSDIPMDALLSDEYTALRRPLIDMGSASHDVRPGDPVGMKALLGRSVIDPTPGGTTTCCVWDKWGNVVAATPSANMPSGGGRTGVAHGNRVRSMNTMPGHPNRVEAGKRPRVTLTPTLVLRDGRPFMAMSVAGGDMQDQTGLNVLLNVIDFGMTPEAAVTAPRFCTRHHEDSFKPHTYRPDAYVALGNLHVNEAVPEDVVTALRARGHEITTTRGPISAPSIILRDASGTLRAAGDPMARRHAGAF